MLSEYKLLVITVEQLVLLAFVLYVLLRHIKIEIIKFNRRSNCAAN